MSSRGRQRPETSGLHEEPPHSLNAKALAIALTVALMAEATPVDETHVMRKVVIDGSTPFGFQRTAVVATNGKIKFEDKEVLIQTICLEEDACRKIEEKGRTTYYRLDRLGVPLIEVVTGPVIYTPREAEEIALTLGQILRTTGKVKRGLGTIRQDLNISIQGGALIEIKGVQVLDVVSKAVKYEVQRQVALLKITEELKRRTVRTEDLNDDFVDVSRIFKKTKCLFLRKALKKNHKVMAGTLPRFSGLLKVELIPGLRFGSELADYAKFWGGVGGILHTDELPDYGITREEITQLRTLLKAEEEDAIVLIADEQEKVVDGLKAIMQRAQYALTGVPSETRGATLDGITHYTRPRPGAARMYPETDVPPVPITPHLLNEIRSNLPEKPEIMLSRLRKKIGLNNKLATQILNSDYLQIFLTLASRTRIAPSFIAATLTETLKGFQREGYDVSILSDRSIVEIFNFVEAGQIAKEAVPEILAWMTQHREATPMDGMKALGLGMISKERLEILVKRTISENEELIRERKNRAFSSLMGIVMKELRGRVDARTVSDLLKEQIKNFLREADIV